VTFYNTNQTPVNERGKEEKKNSNQEHVIAAFFRDNPKDDFTPFEVQEHVFNHNVPVTSVRRALTNLTSSGVLEKTLWTRMGNYGKRNMLWRLKNE